MDCNLSPVLNSIENCCQRLITENNENQALVDALYYLIELRTGQLENKLDNVNQLVIDILNEFNIQLTGQIDIGFSEQPKNAITNESIPVGYYKYKYDSFDYGNKPFLALNQAVELLDQKITSVHKDVVKAIELPLDLPNLLPTECKDNEDISLDNIDLDNAPDFVIDDFRTKRGAAFQSFLVGTAFDFLLDMG